MISSIATSDLVRELLVECIGTVMVEWEQWNFNEPSFDRGYFNDRIKCKKPVNALTRQRLKRLFEMVLSPGNRTGKFQEPQAVAAANGFIVLIEKYFHLDLSAWENHYTIDNSVPRSYLLCCLDIVLSLIENTENVPIEKIRESLDNYIRDVQSVENIPFAVTPIPLARIPAKADYVFGREATVSDLVGKLISGQSCYLHGIGGIGKTEIAK